MTTSELWSRLGQHQVTHSHFFGRSLMALSRLDFEVYQEHFITSYNPLNGQANYRTMHPFAHIHAVADGDMVECHIDYFNPSRFLLFAIPHLFVSVIPYFLWCILTLKKPYKVYSK